MKRPEILDEAKKIVCGQREQDYGTPEDSFYTTGRLWDAYLRAAHPEYYATNAPVDGITPKDVAMMLGCLKVARIARGDKPDSYIDLAGYAACAGEIATQEKEKEAEKKEPEFVKENQCAMCGAVIPADKLFCPECKEKIKFFAVMVTDDD